MRGDFTGDRELHRLANQRSRRGLRIVKIIGSSTARPLSTRIPLGRGEYLSSAIAAEEAEANRLEQEHFASLGGAR